MLQQRRSRGGAQLAPDLPAVDGHALQEQGRGRGGDGEDAVGAADLAAAHMDGGGRHSVRGQQLHQETESGHIRHRVQGADLVEVDVLHTDAVDGALRGGDAVIDSDDMSPHGLAYVQIADDGADVRRGAVMMFMDMVRLFGALLFMCMAVVVAVLMFAVVAVLVVMLPDVQGFFLLSVHGDAHVGAVDAAFVCELGLKADMGDPQGVELFQDRLSVVEKLQQGGGEHVARGAHGAVKMQQLHGFFSI